MPKKQAKQQFDVMPVVLIAIGFLLIVGVLLWQVLRSGQQNQAASPAAGQTGAPQAGAVQAQDPNIPEPTIQRVTLADAKAAFDGKTALFLDVRDPTQYKAGHVPGAVNIPLGQLENRLGELNASQWIITYCT